MRYIKDVAEVIRSKNAGPYELTFDIMLPTRELFEEVKGKIAKSEIARLYRIPEENVISIIYFEPAYAVKITIVRPRASGDLGETDVYGAQQHAPLFNLTY